MKPLVIIPARGGSKGVPRKNIRPLGGIPLLKYTVDAALKLFDAQIVCVSTDDMEIYSYAESLGLNLPFIRPAELATDTAGTYQVLLHALQEYEQNGYHADTVILLQPTSPFRTHVHIREAMDLYTSDLDMIVSVKEAKANPYFTLFEENDNGFLSLSKSGNYARRQDCPKVWQYNGALYIINADALKKKSISQFKNIKKYVMNERDSLDIDTLLDWDFASYLIAERK